MASKINKGEILAKFFDDGEYTALFADGAVSAACGYAAGQQAYAVYQNGEAVTVKDVEKNIKVLEMAAQIKMPIIKHMRKFVEMIKLMLSYRIKIIFSLQEKSHLKKSHM